jgi:hypothetical protein
MFISSAFKSYNVCGCKKFQSLKCRSPRMPNMTWHDEVTKGDVDLI